MARPPIVLHNPPPSPLARPVFDDITGFRVPRALTSFQINPVTGVQNRVYMIGYESRYQWPSYDTSNLRRPPGYGKQP
jgi:hypothetical protein